MIMSKKAIIECVPNFSEGVDMSVIDLIAREIKSVNNVSLLNIDPGKATNRTVVTFVGPPDDVITAAFLAIRKSYELIDMSAHKGAHPRMGATDVCPLIPISGISMEEVVRYSHKLAKKVGDELNVPVFLYESSATNPLRKNLATIRSGEYEGLQEKLKYPEWKPDYGPAEFVSSFGAVAIGARDFLVAYNVNLNTRSVRRANSVAFDVREAGRVKREGNPITGPIVRDKDGNAMRIPGVCKSVKAIGWFIEEYDMAQISMNLTDISITSLHEAFEACRKSANSRGLRVTGSEIVGLVPKKVLVDAGRFYLKNQQRSMGIPEAEVIQTAIHSLGLNEITSFKPEERIIEYLINDNSVETLKNKTISEFTAVVASESPAPGGGSVSAYVGALGVSLGAMVANLSAHKRGWDDRWEVFSGFAENGESLRVALLELVDEDTRAFNSIIEAVRLPKETEEEKKDRLYAIQEATKRAIDVPLKIMQTAYSGMDLLKQMALNGNPNSVSDAGVGALCLNAAISGAYFNVMINCKDLEDEGYKAKAQKEAEEIIQNAKIIAKEVSEIVMKKTVF